MLLGYPRFIWQPSPAPDAHDGFSTPGKVKAGTPNPFVKIASDALTVAERGLVLRIACAHLRSVGGDVGGGD